MSGDRLIVSEYGGITLDDVALLNRKQIPSDFGTKLYNRLPTPAQKSGLAGGGDIGTLDDVSNTLYVDANTPSGGDGSQASPFDTINAAIALIQANGDAAANNRYTVRIAAGTYDENVRARVSYTTFLGEGRDITTVAASSGMGFYGGNATEASLDAFEAAGSPAKALVDADYVDLVKDGALPEITGNVIQGLTIAKHTSNYTDLMLMNVDDGDSTTALGWSVRDVYVFGDTYLRNMILLNTDRSIFRYEMRVRNVRSWSQREGEVGNLTTLYDGAQPKPGAGLGTLAYLSLNDVYSYDNVHVENCLYRLEEMEVNNTLTIKDGVGSTAVMRDVEATNIVLEGSTHASTSINGLKALTGLQINNPVAINAAISNPSIGTGGITAASGGTNNVQIKGGQILGPITDPDGYVVVSSARTARERRIAVSNPTPPGETTLTANQVDETIVSVDSSATAQDVTLPVLTSAEIGYEVVIKRKGVLPVTVTAGSGQTIDDAAFFVIPANNNALRISFDGASNWDIV